MASFLSQSLACSRQTITRTICQSQARVSPATIRFASAAAHASSPKPTTPNSHSKPPTPRPTKTPEELGASLGYFVRRTPSVQLPIYRTLKSGNTRQVITIKKVDGDKRKMLQELSEALSMDKANIRINPTTQHIELKVGCFRSFYLIPFTSNNMVQGNYFDQARNWLLERGF
jgi:large subunit ribosomal protein L49